MQASFLDMEEQYRINAFDWQEAFPQVFSRGGFDVVIGNPPLGCKFKYIKKISYFRSMFNVAKSGTR